MWLPFAVGPQSAFVDPSRSPPAAGFPPDPVAMMPAQAAPIGLRKAPTGIAGFDEITNGGLPFGRTSLLIGSPGAGKTIFALETLVNAARDHGESGIFIAFEENSTQVIENAATFGWDLPALERDRLFFLNAKLPATVVNTGAFDLEGILAALTVKVAEMKCTRIVFDGIDVLLSLLNDPEAERREIFRLHGWMMDAGITGIITAKAEESDRQSVERYAFMQFMVDCIVVLQHRVADRVSLRGLRVVKYRGSSFEENEFPLIISRHGIDVSTFGAAEMDHDVSDERVPTGVAPLDTMLDGGYYRGSSVLVTGAPGTAKTTLAGSFVAASCERGERALYISFDEAADQIVRNLASVGLHLQAHREAGLLHMRSMRTEVMSAEAHFIRLKALIAEIDPRCMVLDPISALAKTGGHIAAVHASLRILDYAKSRGITVFCTSLISNPDTLTESTETQISTIADTWIHVSYVPSGGERNRALTIVKSRGMKHSNQVREMVLTEHGVTLTDVYTAGGEVLMGTARFEKEAEVHAEGIRLDAVREQKRRELELAEAETAARIAVLQRELEARRAELAVVELEATEGRDRAGSTRDAVQLLRLGLLNPGGPDAGHAALTEE